MAGKIEPLPKSTSTCGACHFVSVPVLSNIFCLFHSRSDLWDRFHESIEECRLQSMALILSPSNIDNNAPNPSISSPARSSPILWCSVDQGSSAVPENDHKPTIRCDALLSISTPRPLRYRDHFRHHLLRPFSVIPTSISQERC